MPGIYFRLDAKGKRSYEFTYRDAEGKQRWQGGYACIKDADDARDKIKARLRRGERVAPIKATFGDFAAEWLDSKTQIRAGTRAKYQWGLTLHLVPRFGRFKLGEITDRHVSLLIADMQAAGYAGATIKSVVGQLADIMERAVRRGAIAINPVAGVERQDRPSAKRRAMRILDRAEIGGLLDAAPEHHRTLMATLTFCGLRISEALGLLWRDIDFERGVIAVRFQLDERARERVPPKTENAERDVVLMPALAKMLREHRLRSRWSGDDAWVFASAVGGPLNRHNVSARIFRPTIKRAGLAQEGRPRVRLHDLRHTCASLLIAGGASVVFVSRQLGHSTASMTLDTYSHLFDQQEHGARMSEMLESQFGATLEGGR